MICVFKMPVVVIVVIVEIVEARMGRRKVDHVMATVHDGSRKSCFRFRG